MITKAQSKRYAPRAVPEQNPRLTQLEKGLLRWSTAENGDKILDTHVGTGRMLEYLYRNAACEVCGLSEDMENVRVSRSRLRNADIVYGSHEDIPWREETFDSVYLKAIADPLSEKALTEALRVLKPGGQLLVGMRTVPVPLRYLVTWFQGTSDDDLLYPRARYQALAMMRRLGLTNITWQATDAFNGVCIGWKALPSERMQL
jgi:SAM-dependent methyltransferase